MVLMVLFPVVLSRLIAWLLYPLLANSFYKAAKKTKNYALFLFTNATTHQTPPPLVKSPPTTKQAPFKYPVLTRTHLENLLLREGSTSTNTLVCDINGPLLRSCCSTKQSSTHSVSSNITSFFPYFMLVAFEGGSIVRAFFLLLSYPILLLLNDDELQLRVMVFVTFCGMRVKSVESVERTVLPKFFLEDLNPIVYDLWQSSSSGARAVITSVPRVMVKGFLKEYLGADHVVGTELHSVVVVGGSFFTGLIQKEGLVVKHVALKGYFGERRPDVGVGKSSVRDHLVLSQCKEAYVVNGAGDEPLPRHRYPKPLIFHDGRLAFFPTPLATLHMFAWLPLALPLSIFRILLGAFSFLPYPLSLFLGSLTGVRLTAILPPPSTTSSHSHALYVCTHRTLLDPVFLTYALRRPLTAVTYSLSKLSEIIAPIRTVRLTRDRDQDRITMARLLAEGDLVVCPEGTTCREPYLLRFSSLFAELTDEIVPVAMEAEGVSMFYGTTATGFKWLDPVFFFMNPRPGYRVRVMGRVRREMTCGGGGKTSFEVANAIQRELGEALGFECTELTRKDKYMMLAGHEGFVGGGRSRG